MSSGWSPFGTARSSRRRQKRNFLWGECMALKGKTKTVEYDVAEQLRTPEEMAAYLDAWLQEAPDDAVGIARALGDIARAHCRHSSHAMPG